ncbi:MAG: DsrE family protein [Burkholderiales bacterium]|nr:DsrE family protein [Burkholderiales bacterium]
MKDTVILVTREGMGSAEPALQRTLIGTYLKLLLENGKLPTVICFYADGVKLAAEGSPVLAELDALEKQGVHLVLCLTCLKYFGLTDKVKVGIVGGMGDILAAQGAAAKVISI